MIFVRFDGENFDFDSISNYAHTGMESIGNYRGRPFITGDGYVAPNLKTEILNTDLIWEVVADYPFTSYL